jgi:hypothetical protein
VGKEPRRYRRWRLALLGRALTDGLAIKDTAIQIHVGSSKHGIWDADAIARDRPFERGQGFFALAVQSDPDTVAGNPRTVRFSSAR